MPRSAPSLPTDFEARAREQLGDEAGAFLSSLQAPGPRAVRANPHKASIEEVCRLLGIPHDPVPWCPSASYVPEGVRVGGTPAHAAGLFYVQEPSALAVVSALAIEPSHAVLDVAAAPGGKATHAAGLLGDDGLLVANEVERGRLGALNENLDLCGFEWSVATTSAPVLAGGFDRVIVDAPCSGEALFRRDPAACAHWSPAHVAGSARRQTRLLAAAADRVAPSGLLAYSTCTFNVEENEAQVERLLHDRPDWSLVHTARFWPHRQRCDGHYLAVLRAPAADPTPSGVRASRMAQARTPEREVVAVMARLGFGLERPTVEQGGVVYLVPPRWSGPAARPGLPLGTVARDGRFLPSHALALSRAALRAGPVEALEADELSRFRQGAPVDRPGEPGWVLVGFEGWPVGWGYRTGRTLKPRLPKRVRAR
jgi:16S rRNA C967 or C1407 C5-methylase (RsmB/RsmF family)/NOL1/NOP2/fmu family ribosome biogenesis protein